MAKPARFVIQAGVLLAATIGCGMSARGAAPSATAPPPARAALPPAGFLEGCLSLMQAKHYRQAREKLLPVVADHPEWGRAVFYLGLTYHKEDRYAEALPLLDRAIELEPDYHPPRFYRAWCQYYLGDLVAARAGFEAFLGLNPDYPDAVFALGLIDFDADDMAAARRRFARTIELAAAKQDKSTEAKARARLSDVLIRLDEVSAARQELDRSLALNPENHEAWFKLSRILDRLGDAEGAERARQKQAETFARAHPTAPRPIAQQAP